MTDKTSMYWYYKDINIEGGGGEDASTKHVRKRSRHDCHFPPGASIPLCKNKFMDHQNFLFFIHIPIMIYLIICDELDHTK